MSSIDRSSLSDEDALSPQSSLDAPDRPLLSVSAINDRFEEIPDESITLAFLFDARRAGIECGRTVSRDEDSSLKNLGLVGGALLDSNVANSAPGTPEGDFLLLAIKLAGAIVMGPLLAEPSGLALLARFFNIGFLSLEQDFLAFLCSGLKIDVPDRDGFRHGFALELVLLSADLGSNGRGLIGTK